MARLPWATAELIRDNLKTLASLRSGQKLSVLKEGEGEGEWANIEGNRGLRERFQVSGWALLRAKKGESILRDDEYLRPLTKFFEEANKVVDKGVVTRDDLTAGLAGFKNLRGTYARDPQRLAKVDEVLTSIEGKLTAPAPQVVVQEQRREEQRQRELTAEQRDVLRNALHRRRQLYKAIHSEYAAREVDVSSAPPHVLRQLPFGHLSAGLATWLIEQGKLLDALDSNEVDVRVLKPLGGEGGATAITVLGIDYRGSMPFVLKEVGLFFSIDGVPVPPDQMYPAPDRVVRFPGGEHQDLHIVKKSALGNLGALQAPEGVRLRLALAADFFTYQTPLNLVNRLEHQITVLHAGEGDQYEKIIDKAITGQLPKEQLRRASTAIGAAIGALHRRFLRGRASDGPGLRTYVHGDFYSPNVFYRADRNLVTLIDTASMAASIRKDGYDMFIDLRRMHDDINSRLDRAPELRDAAMESFLTGYATNFRDHRGRFDRAEHLLPVLHDLKQRSKHDAGYLTDRLC